MAILCLFQEQQQQQYLLSVWQVSDSTHPPCVNVDEQLALCSSQMYLLYLLRVFSSHSYCMYLWAVEKCAFLIGAMGEKPGDGTQHRFEQVESPFRDGTSHPTTRKTQKSSISPRRLRDPLHLDLTVLVSKPLCNMPSAWNAFSYSTWIYG